MKNLYLGVLLIGGLACGPSEETSRITLVDTAGACEQKALEEIDSIRVILAGATAEESACVAVEVKTLEEMRARFADTVAFPELKQGEHSITIHGFDNKGCAKDDVIACGRADFSVPPTRNEIPVPMICPLDDEPEAFKQCQL